MISSAAVGPENGHAARRDASRNQLLDAVESLVREEGVGFSTRALATRAGMSPTSTFNHFGSKRGALSALIARTLDRLVESPLPAHLDPLAGILAGCDAVTEMYAADPDLYRPVLGELLGSGATPALVAKANCQWEASLVLARRARLVRPGLDLALLASQIELVWGGTLVGWTAGHYDGPAWIARARHAVALVLVAVTADGELPRMRRRLRAAEASVASTLIGRP